MTDIESSRGIFNLLTTVRDTVKVLKFPKAWTMFGQFQGLFVVQIRLNFRR